MFCEQLELMNLDIIFQKDLAGCMNERMEKMCRKPLPSPDSFMWFKAYIRKKNKFRDILFYKKIACVHTKALSNLNCLGSYQ